MPLTFTSLINGSEMFPSVLTTTVWETSGSFHTLTRITSESPTIYPRGTSTAGLASAGLGMSADLAVSEVAGSGDLRSAACVCAIRLQAQAIEKISAIRTICFLNENIISSGFSVKIRFSSPTGENCSSLLGTFAQENYLDRLKNDGHVEGDGKVLDIKEVEFQLSLGVFHG